MSTKQPAVRRQPKRILLVDDNDAFLEQLASCLAELPEAEVVGKAKSGLEALDASLGRVLDLVIMDLAMPGMNGLEATRRLKARAGAPSVWIVTLQDDEESRAAALRAGADEFVPKQRLIERLLDYLNGRPAVGRVHSWLSRNE